MLDSDFICKTTRTQFLSPDGYSLHSLHGKDMKGHQGKPPPYVSVLSPAVARAGKGPGFPNAKCSVLPAMLHSA